MQKECECFWTYTGTLHLLPYVDQIKCLSSLHFKFTHRKWWENCTESWLHSYGIKLLNFLRFPKSIQAKFLFTLGYLVKVEVCMDVSHYPATPAILIACAGVRGQRAGFSFHTPYRTAGSVRVCTRAALRIQPWQAWCNWLREVNP